MYRSKRQISTDRASFRPQRLFSCNPSPRAPASKPTPRTADPLSVSLREAPALFLVRRRRELWPPLFPSLAGRSRSWDGGPGSAAEKCGSPRGKALRLSHLSPRLRWMLLIAKWAAGVANEETYLPSRAGFHFRGN